jgi:DnaJ-class molecular chaperone
MICNSSESRWRGCYDKASRRAILLAITTHHGLESVMTSQKGPNIKKKQKCKNCEGKGLLKKGDKVVKCQRCGGTGVR